MLNPDNINKDLSSGMVSRGKLILVTGFYGAGKSTLVRTALSVINNLEYLKTVTTRQPRPEEIEHGSIEYEFVSHKEYVARRSKSRNWDHTYLQEHSYGADVDMANSKLAEGISLICCVAPDENTISQMTTLYNGIPVIIWIDASLKLANERLIASGNQRRIERMAQRLQSETNAAKIKSLSQIIFEPANLRNDEINFIRTIKQLCCAPLEIKKQI